MPDFTVHNETLKSDAFLVIYKKCVGLNRKTVVPLSLAPQTISGFNKPNYNQQLVLFLGRGDIDSPQNRFCFEGRAFIKGVVLGSRGN